VNLIITISLMIIMATKTISPEDRFKTLFQQIAAEGLNKHGRTAADTRVVVGEALQADGKPMEIHDTWDDIMPVMKQVGDEPLSTYLGG